MLFYFKNDSLWVKLYFFIPLQGSAHSLSSPQVRTTLGPRGMDKLIVDHNGKAVISNDGATIMKLLDIVHPAAKTLVDIAKSQDAEVRVFLYLHIQV